MKISKLFHWLYAILMLLPFAFFVPSVLYYAFNDNATMQSVEVPKTETILVDFNQLLDNGDFSNGSNNWAIINNADLSINNGVAKVTAIESGDIALKPVNTLATIESHKYVVRVNVRVSSSNINARLSTVFVGSEPTSNSTSFVVLDMLSYANRDYPSYTSYPQILVQGANIDDYFEVKNFMLFDLTQMFGNGNEPTLVMFNHMFPLEYYDYTISQHMQVTYDTGETMELVENTDIINYAWESIWDLPLFSWCKVSFVSVPFTYITGLFGLATSNSFNYVFTYFASMSIIWLVFDVILYVPLLVHRWLDKGIVE